MGEAFVLLLALLFSVIIRTYSCSTSELDQCFVVLQSLAKSDDLAFASTKDELHLVCRKLQQGVKCVDEHTLRCYDSIQQRLHNSVVSGSRQVIEDLCVEGELQQDYLRHAPCFKNISTDPKKCATKYQKVAILSQESKEEDKDTHLKAFCCALKDFTLCQHEHVVRDCGPRASQFLQHHMSRMAGSLMNEHCVLFTYGSDSCSSGCRHSKLPQKPTHQAVFLIIFLGVLCWA
ncbi:uncharacterized protein LOC118183993 [Stegodyphus dumicola]|uniref:uncharacterized protein LOC118183993 n=1 Tax=Stegodyphus dumicola TaxID=202533 RepID=UPI0015B33DAF|nr:uncharacterized protein LOC118183993 [Stegodyphus dumicola]